MLFPYLNFTNTRLGKSYYFRINRLLGRRTWYGYSEERATFDETSSSELLRSLIAAGNPFMVARFGANELGCVLDYLQRSGITAWSNYLTGKRPWVGYRRNILRDMEWNAGFFPINPKSLERFAQKVIEDSALLDVLGTWILEEEFVSHYHPQAKLIPLRLLEPFWSDVPWTSSLAGKRVLVIHPFAKTIESQFQRRKQLFKDTRILPDFDLVTLKAIQSAARQPTDYGSWFEALDCMAESMAKINFDIALIGCGAYGFSLAAHAKRIGKQALHLGGATQLLFGIAGARWIERPEYRNIMNEHWTKPSEEERPVNFKQMENGCYW